MPQEFAWQNYEDRLSGWRDAQFEMKWGNLTAGSIISFIPIIIIYSLLQRYFIRGIIGSAVKE